MRFENETQKKIDTYYNERLKKVNRQVICLAIILIVSIINV